MSADAFQTGLFIIQLVTLALVVWLLSSYTNSQVRLRYLVDVVIATGFFVPASELCDK